jgi:hypothetical protein
MLNYLERYALMRNESFRSRVQVTLWIVCTEVLDENANTPNHAARAAKAEALLKSEADVDTMRKLELRLVANDAIGGQGMDVTDAALKNAVSNTFNSIL